MYEVSEINYLAVIIATILTNILGAVWYNVNVFGKVWAEIHEYDPSCLKGSPLRYFGSFINMLVMAWVLGFFYAFFGIATILGSMYFAFWAWLGFVATSHFSGVIWARKPFKAYCIDTGFFLVALQIMAVVFGIFN